MSVFISYSHKDEDEKNHLMTHLGVLEHARRADLWVDDRIGTGGDWQADIRRALDAAEVGVLLITANFLTSKFILSQEVPALLEKRQRHGLVVYPVIARHSAWRQVEWLTKMNVRPKNGTPVWSSGSDPDEALAKIAGEIAAVLEEKKKLAAASSPSAQPPAREAPAQVNANDEVLEYKSDILELRGTFEARTRYPRAGERVKSKGRRLATLIDGLDDQHLDKARRIIKYQYGGWVLLMVARVYGEEDEADKIKRYTLRAVERLRKALDLMAEAKRGHARGQPEDVAVYEWIISPSADLDRTRYLLALALAVNAKVGGDFTLEEAREELAKISEEYLEEYPIEYDEYLRRVQESP